MEFTQEESALLETLAKATSQDVNLIKSAETKLSQWEVEPGYYSTLMKIILNHSIEPTVRWLAVSVFKNGINRYWRKGAENAIPELEKVSLRCDVMKALGEPVNAVAIQMTAAISKIARFDCPKEWPELIPNLIEIIKNDNLLIQYRGLLTLNQVIKALASKRLFLDRKIFESIAQEIYPFMLNYWNVLFQTFALQVNDNDPLCQGSLEKILLTVKILRKLTIFGFYQKSVSDDVRNFLTALFDRIRDMFFFRKYGEKISQFKDLCEKVISHMMKVLLTFQEYHPCSFLPFIETSLNFVRTFLFTSRTEENDLFEKFIIQCLNLMKDIILCADYKTLNERCYYEENKMKEKFASEGERIKAEFFQTEVLEEICTKLITHYFLLTPKDLQLWEDDPETFAFDAESPVGDSCRYYLHPCTHSLYLVLLRQYRDILSPLVLKLVRNNQQLVDPQDLNGILKKDAVYCSIGLRAFEFYDEVDFDQWFTTTLVHELGIKESNYRIIRRRVVWLIGKWTDVKPAVELRPTICGAVIPLLHKDEDMVVRLTAAIALKSVVDSLEFTPDQFMDFLGPSFSMLFSLLQEVKECSSKMQILDVLSFIVGRVGEEIRPYSQSLIQYLPLLWEANHNMLRCAIVSTLIQFVRGLVSENLTSFLYPVIQCCTDMKDDAHVYLLDDGLKLWFTVIEYSTNLTPELMSLYKNMFSILENTFEHLERCCNITQAYILLSPEEFLGEYGESFITLCVYQWSDMHEKDKEKIMQVVETAIKASPKIAIKISYPILEYVLFRVLERNEWAVSASIHFALIGRVLLYSKEVFLEILQKAGKSKWCTAENLLENILREWNVAMPLVTQLEKRKLLALALTSLLTFQTEIALAQFGAIMRNIVEALNDIMDIDCLSAELNSMKLVEDPSLLSDDYTDDDTKIEKRKKQLNESDPVYKIELRAFLQSQLNELKNQIGAVSFERHIRTVNSEILQQCRMYISI